MVSDHSPTVSVVGLGYIGLPTAAMFASRKIPVIGVDVNKTVVDTINQGRIHIVEPNLDSVVRTAVEEGYLRAVTRPEPATAFLIAVPTPIRGPDHVPDVTYVEEAAISIAPVLKRGDLIVIESTSPVGTTEAMAGILAKARPDLTFPQTHGEQSDIRIAYCPERVLPGKVILELVSNDRVIGGMTAQCSAEAIALYRSFVTGNCIATNARTAEMAKLTENSFRDVNIAFANELSIICDRLKIDVWELISLAKRHPRVEILRPGAGVGGHCIAVDPWFIVAATPEDARLIRTAREVNDSKPEWVLAKIYAALATFPSDPELPRPVVACYGLAFKPDIDDLRDSPALAIAERLTVDKRCDLFVVEPHIDESPASLESATLVTADEAASANIHVLLVDHSAFKEMEPPSGIRIDTRGIGW